MQLFHRGRLEPGEPEAGGSLTGWFIPRTPYLADATARTIRLWDTEQQVLVGSVRPETLGLGQPNGGIVVHPSNQGLVSVHAEAARQADPSGIVLWSLPTLDRRAAAVAHGGSEPGIGCGTLGRNLITHTREEPEGGTVGLAVWNLDLRAVHTWPACPPGEPLLVEQFGWIVVPRCRRGESGVQIHRHRDGRLVRRIADDAPVTHLAGFYEGDLWLFQEEGRLDVWDARRLLRRESRTVVPGESIRDDFPSGCVVCFDWIDPTTLGTLGSDGVVRFWSLPEWEPISDHPFEMTPSWIDLDEFTGRLAVGFFDDSIRLYDVSP